MMLLNTLVLIWAFTIRAGYSQVLDIHGVSDSFEIEDPLYKPWEKNDTDAVWISFEGMGLSSFDSFKLHLKELPEWLILDRNNIQTLSLDAFKDWSANLTYLSLVGNQISTIDTAVINYLKNLQVLVLDNNPIQYTEVIDILCDLTTLQSLYLENCGLSWFYLPSCTNSLTHLHLSNNRIQSFYTKIDSSLTHLYLSHNNIMYITLSQLNSLVYLDLSNNPLTGIASLSSVNPAEKAENFRLRHYYGRYYGSSEGKLFLDGADSLQYLILSNNQITSIEPEAFRDIDTLVLVDFSGNQIHEVYPATFKNMVDMEKILLDRNQIKRIYSGTFVNLPNLRVISLKNNQIRAIDGDVFEQLNTIANNVTLFLDNNQIENLAEGTFRGMKGLAHIGLGGNRIKTISSQAFVDLPNLQSIVIEYQSRDQSEVEAAETVYGLIESNAFYNLSNLISITIRGNSFTEIEAQAFHQLPELKTLDLSNNSLHEISSQAFDDVPNIEELNLEGNKLLRTEPGTFPTQLKRLNLAWNFLREDFEALHIADLHQLEELDVSGVIQSFTVDDLSTMSKKLKVTVGRYNH